jgi:Ca-activated chloride channel family protein
MYPGAMGSSGLMPLPYGGAYGLSADLDSSRPDHGIGPGLGGDRYLPIVENAFKEVKNEPLSTFSIDVDTASYSKVRMYLLQHGTLPRPDAVRIEELVNYFTYSYAPPKDDVPFAAHLEVAECPWAPARRLVRVGIKGKEIASDKRPTSNLVFLLDVSGSMDEPNKLPLVKHGMKMLVDQLGENDRVAIVVYAGAAGMVLDSTTGDQKQVILDALDRLQAGGSTNGGQGIQLAYQTALDRFIRGGVNRVILCTDGDFNVGVTGTDQLVRMAEQNAKTGVFLSVLGFGMGNHNDAMLEQLSGKGNGNYAFIDTEAEARKVLVEQMTGTLVTIAKDVKIQVEFNPQQVAAYRLIGYENRILAAQDFNDDKKDAGEIGAGHTVTALYELVPAGAESGVTVPPVDDLRYQAKGQASEAAQSGELLTLKMRYKQPDGDTSSKLEFPLKDEGKRFGQASQDFRFAASVASFGMLLRDSQFKGNATYAAVQEIATESASGDTSGYREEFLQMVAKAKELAGS